MSAPRLKLERDAYKSKKIYTVKRVRSRRAGNVNNPAIDQTSVSNLLTTVRRNLEYGTKSGLKSHLRSNLCYPFRFAETYDENPRYVGSGSRSFYQSGLLWTITCENPEFATAPLYPAWDWALHSSAAYYQAWDSACDKFDSLSLAVDMVEMPKTVSMLRSAIDLVRAARRGNPKSVYASIQKLGWLAGHTLALMNADYRQAAKRGKFGTRRNDHKRASTLPPVHQWWLEARFGYGPLIMSIEGLLAELVETDPNIALPIKSSGKTLKTYTDSVTTSALLWTDAYGNVSASYKADRKTTLTLRSYQWWKHQEWSAARGIIGEPAEILWELIPLSFVVDRFWGIGQAIKRATALQGGKFIQAGEVIEIEYEVNAQTLSGLPNNTTAKGTLRSKYYKRLAVSQRENRILNNFDSLGTSVKHITDYIALGLQLFRR